MRYGGIIQKQAGGVSGTTADAADAKDAHSEAFTGGNMADSPKKPKVGVYGADSTETVSEATDSNVDTQPNESKGGGLPIWIIAAIVIVLVILALIYFL